VGTGASGERGVGRTFGSRLIEWPGRRANRIAGFLYVAVLLLGAVRGAPLIRIACGLSLLAYLVPVRLVDTT
jgi:hypothetical protein